MWTVDKSLPLGDYFSQDYPPLQISVGYPIAGIPALHPGLSTATDNCDWFKGINQARTFSPIAEL